MGIASKKLRVAMIAPDFPMGETINGGIQGVTLFLGQSLRKSGEIDLDIVFPFAPAEAIGLKNVHGLNVHALKRNRSAVFLDPVHYLKVMKAIQKHRPGYILLPGRILI